MEHPEEHYYKLNRFLLSVSGLWPYQSKWSARLMRAIITIAMLSSIVVQLSSFFTSDMTAEFIIEVLPIVTTLGSLGHMYARVRNVDKLRDLFERIWYDWRLQKTHYEIKIMHEHAETTRLFTLYYLVLMYTCSIGYNLWIFIPEILDIISPMNESRPRTIPFKVEFFINEERYFYLIRSHMCIMVFIIPIMFLTSSTLLLALTQHVCGMCELLGYRAERLFRDVEDSAGCNLTQGSKLSCGNMAVLVRLHYNVIDLHIWSFKIALIYMIFFYIARFVGIIGNYHTIPFLMDILGLVLAMSIALTQILTVGDNIDRAFKSILFTIVSLAYLILITYMGQKITDVSSSVCEKVYNSAWYDAVISEQKLLLLIMKRRFRPLVLTACRYYVISLQNYGKILQTAISFCMFMRQL